MRTFEIAEKNKVDRRFIRMIEKGERFTENIQLAQDIAAKNGKRPIQYISRKIRKLALAAHPFLNDKIGK